MDVSSAILNLIVSGAGDVGRMRVFLDSVDDAGLRHTLGLDQLKITIRAM